MFIAVVFVLHCFQALALHSLSVENDNAKTPTKRLNETKSCEKSSPVFSFDFNLFWDTSSESLWQISEIRYEVRSEDSIYSKQFDWLPYL